MLAHSGAAELEPFWKDVDPRVADALDPAQKQEILAAVSRRASEDHAADVRLSFLGYFLVVIFGKERRGKDRMLAERRKRPVLTLRNLPLIIVIWGSVIYTAFSFMLPAIKQIVEAVL